ncbi:PadR family transcriptional regulator [Streptomonospora sp. PA3]|uniref:PadR family transcriptional regulator n=1 Tax=Streptomonospora sp. PA3 TaxID=2607326 RepID=UPI0012DCA8B2|nr:PadR family transcriptional regulator [Streptomonospora sp. PA3]MUL39909.1 PadR family transcriptional regulator [Streptomonospora sp. PA3]
MSTIFGHGRLRLYLLKLLDESPRHGYEIISLLRDRFLGVYSPSPGTIYPRLARLEEEGLVTHEEVDGRKVYRLTDRGREELRNRSSDLDDLEREITESVRDVAEAVREDVRHTISSLREELKFGGAGRRTRGDEAGAGAREGGDASGAERDGGARERPRGEGASRGGPRWARDWERFTQGFGAWGKHAGGDKSEFDQALRDFTERVRGVVREAGHVGESAAHDLRRILDDTFETIRRDMSGWGPRDTEEEPEEDRRDRGAGAEGDRGDRPGAAGDSPGGTAGGTGTGTGAGAGSQASGPEGSGEGSGDSWSHAVDDPTRGPGGRPDQPDRPEDTAGSGDPWSTAVNDDEESDGRRGGPAT